jgi:hypothetical protein
MSQTHLLSRPVLLIGLLGCAAMAHAQSAPTSSLTIAKHPVADFGYAVPNARLDTVRGGFDLGGGMEVSFGIERAVYIDGNLVTYTNVNIPDVARMTTAQAMSLASALSTINVVNGPGNTFNSSSLGSTTGGTVIQNTLNNQTIRSFTTLNVSVNTLNQFRDEGLQQMLQNASVQALGH